MPFPYKIERANISRIRQQIGQFLNEIWQALQDHINDNTNPHDVLHDQLTDVTEDQHHPKLHDLGSHTDVDLTSNLPLKEGQGIWFDADTLLWKNRAASAEQWPTGLVDGGELNIGPGINDIEVIAGLATIVDSYTSPNDPPTITGVSWDQINEAITAAPSTAGSVVWFSIAATVTPAVPPDIGGIPIFVGELHQWPQGPSPTLARQEVFLGVAIHNGVSWKEVSNPKVINQTAETLREVVTAVLPLTTIIQGGATHSQSTFELRQDAGTVWENNRNWHVNKSDPNREALPASDPISFQYVNRDFTDVGVPVTQVDPTQWDNAGTVEAIPGSANTCTIQHLYLDPANNYWMLWGQNTYPNITTALANFTADLFNTVVPFILQNSILLGSAVIEKAKLDWDTNEAVWVPEAGEGGGGGGGTPITDHDNLNGITPDNHHNQIHLLYGPDQSDVDTVIPLEERHVLAWRQSADFGPEFRMNWRNVWAQLTYHKHDTVIDSPYTMVANKTTTDRAAPQDNGLPEWDMPDAPAWSNFSNTSIVGSGHTYAFSETVYVNSIRVWVPVSGPGIFYRVTTVQDGLYTSVDLLGLIPGEWNVIGVDPKLVFAGSQVLVFLESSNTGGSTQVTGGWTRDVNSNNNEPLFESWNRNNAGTVLRIDFDDLNSTDRQSELEGIIVGSTIVMAETAIPSNYTEFQVLANPVTGLTSVSYFVAITDSGAAEPTIGETTTMTADVPIAQSTDFVGIVNGWVGTEPVWADVTSFLSFDGVDQGVDPDNQYGISINVQRLTISPDWDIMALSGVSGGGSGGGGGTSFWESSGDDIQNINSGLVKILNTLVVGVINELNLDAGVTVESVLLKDGGVSTTGFVLDAIGNMTLGDLAGLVPDFVISRLGANARSVSLNTSGDRPTIILLDTAGNAWSIGNDDGVFTLLEASTERVRFDIGGSGTWGASQTFNAGIKTDSIVEATPDVGVTIDGVLIKDGLVDGVDIGNDAARLGTAQEYTKQHNFNATALVDGANIAWNTDDNQVCSVTLGGDRTLNSPTNMKDGATYLLRVIQDGTGTRLLSYQAAYKWEGGTPPVLSTAPGSVDVLTFISDGTNMYGVAALNFS